MKGIHAVVQRYISPGLAMTISDQGSAQLMELYTTPNSSFWITTRNLNFSLTELGTEKRRAMLMKRVVQSVHKDLVPFFPPLEHTLNVICLKDRHSNKTSQFDLDVYLLSGTWGASTDQQKLKTDNSTQNKIFTFTSLPHQACSTEDLVDSQGITDTEQLVISQTYLGRIQHHKHDSFNLDNFPLADGILTDCYGIAPGVTVADCFPIFLGGATGDGKAVYGLVHSGWKGTGILAVAANSLNEIWGIPYSQQEVIIGPGICGNCYPVGTERAGVLQKRFGKTGIVQVPGTGAFKGLPQPGFDLPEINQSIAKCLGIKQCTDTRLCTFDHDLLWSHRRFQYEQGNWSGRRDCEANGISIQNHPEPIDGRMFAFVTPIRP